MAPAVPGQTPPTSSRRSEVFRAKRYPVAIVSAGVHVAALVPQSAHAAPKPATQYDWPQFAFDAGKSANDTAETTVNLGNVGDGTEVKAGGWPVTTGPGKNSSALTIATARNGHMYL